MLRKVRYLTKRDLIHLLTIRGIVINEYSIDGTINALFKDIHKKKQASVIEDICRYHHKQKLKNLKQEIYSNLHNRQNQLIINELKELKKLKLSNLLKKANISQEDQPRNIETTGLKKSDLIYILLRSQKHHAETKYLEYLQSDPVNEIKSKINEIRKYIIELGMMIDKPDKDKIRKRLDEIDKKTRISRAEKTRLLEELSKILLNLEYKRKRIRSAYDSTDYYGLKDLEYTFGDFDDYYKPILAKESFNRNYQMFTCRGDKNRDMDIDVSR